MLLLPELLWTIAIFSHLMFSLTLVMGKLNYMGMTLFSLSLFGVIFTWVNVFM